MSKIKENLDKIEENIALLCKKAGKNRDDITLVAVTKTAAPEQIKEVYDLGYRVFGENRLPHLSQAFEYMSNSAPKNDPVRWDMIGHLQRNKVADFLPMVERIHSVDSMRLADQISQTAQKLNRTVDVFIQANCSNEDQKFGISPDQAVELAQMICEQLPVLRLTGVMTMAAFTDDQLQIAASFRLAKKIFDRIKDAGFAGGQFSRLSMGMTNDYHIAIMEGATDIRIGSAIFA